jgi:creatinine amidohydrolase
MSQVELAEMTWSQAAAARDRGAVVLITVGTQEENGSVCPLATDTILAYEVARRVAEQTVAVVAPPINYGYSSTFAGFPGTMALKPDTLRRVIVDVCDNLIENGFEHLLLLNCHLPNEPIMQQAAKEIGARHGVLIGSFNPIVMARSASKGLYSDGEASFGHGAEPIASMIRSFNPGAVHVDEARSEGAREFQGLPVAGTAQVRVDDGLLTLYFNWQKISETGGTGNPSVSDPNRGAEIMRRVVDQACKLVKAFAGLDVKQGA